MLSPKNGSSHSQQHPSVPVTSVAFVRRSKELVLLLLNIKERVFETKSAAG